MAISIYKKLTYYQKDIRELHIPSQIGFYTFSNIITTRGIKFGNNGLDIPEGYIIFRTLDDKVISYLRLGVMENPFLLIKDVTYKITAIHSIPKQDILSSDINFKSISPVLVRNFENRKMYISDEREIQQNLNLVLNYQIKTYFGIDSPNIAVSNISSRKKTVRISSNGKKESITSGFNLSGKIIGSPEIISLLYYRGLGSKTSLGLGCWEVE